MRRGLTIYLRLSHGTLEAGPGGGPASCCLEISPFMGRTRQLAAHNMRRREPAAWAAESDGKRNLNGRPTGRPLFCERRPSVRLPELSAEVRPILARQDALTAASIWATKTASDPPRRSTMSFLRPGRGRIAQLS